MKTIKQYFKLFLLHPRFHRVMLLLAIIDAVAVVIFLASSQPASSQISHGSVTMLTPSIPVSRDIQERAAATLEKNAAARGVFTYAITSVDKRDPYYMVSVAGFSVVSSPWSLDNAVWLGVITLPMDPKTGGTVENDVLPSSSQQQQPGTPAIEGGGFW